MFKPRLLLTAAVAALLVTAGPVSMAQETDEHHEPATPGVAAPPQPGGAPGTGAAPGQGGGGMPSDGMGMGMMGMGGGMMDPGHMQQMHEMMMGMHGPSGGMPGGMGMMPGMMRGMGGMPGMGMGMMPGMGMGMGMMPGMGMGIMPAVNRRMHREMSQPGSGDADVDFARAMVAHHRGAVDMAKLALAFGDDPEMRRLAEGVIAAQTEEIRTLEAWLQRQQP
ncbi:MAG: hypothetical protein K0S81_1774 [Rhodospirillales bacterium]|nr:hypothetical protein [Rhodospirillales bacterium]